MQIAASSKQGHIFITIPFVHIAIVNKCHSCKNISAVIIIMVRIENKGHRHKVPVLLLSFNASNITWDQE